MTYEERKEWLTSLKEGDMVCIYQSNWCTASFYRFYKIKRVTATQIVSERNTGHGLILPFKFRKTDGRVIGSDSYDRIEPITDQVRCVNRRKQLEDWFRSIIVGRVKQEHLETLKATYGTFENPYMETK